MSKMNITFVCTGNTCRSAMAEGICKKILLQRKIEYINCSSCGLGAFNGDSANEKAVTAMQKLDIDITTHRSRQLNQYIFDETDVMVCMTSNHKSAVMTLKPKFKILVPCDGIPDPYGCSQEIYDECAKHLYVYIEKLVDMLTMQIVDMQEKHVEQIAELEKICFSTPWSFEGIKEEIDNPCAHFIVAESNGKVLGYIGVHEMSGEAYIDNIAVDPDCRRMGIGEALLKKAQSGAFERGCEFISLEVRVSNEKAIDLYKKFGYTEVGERKNFYTNPQENALIMTLKECEYK